MVQMLLSHTQMTTIYKVRVPTNTNGNEQANKLAKIGHKLSYKDDKQPSILHIITSKKTDGTQWTNIQQKPHSILDKHIIIHDKKTQLMHSCHKVSKYGQMD